MLKFGSWALHTDDFESDIDAILCTFQELQFGKKIVKILDHDNGTYFDRFFKFVKAQPCVDSIQKVEEAIVPLLKLKINGIEIDLLLCAKKSYA